MSLFQYCCRTTEFAGYTIKKGTMISLHLWDILHNPEYFPNPDQFNPDRFFDPITQKFKPNPRCIPFLLGQRVCPGKVLALQELLIFLTSLVTRFKFEPVDPIGLADLDKLEPIEGLILTCPNYKVLCRNRE